MNMTQPTRHWPCCQCQSAWPLSSR